MRDRGALLAPILLFVGCGGGEPKCEILAASAEPTTFLFGARDETLAIRAETEACGATDEVRVDAVLNETRQFLVVSLLDDGRGTDGEAGDGIYERTMDSPFYGDTGQIGSGVLRFRPCDPECREPAVEVEILVRPPE